MFGLGGIGMAGKGVASAFERFGNTMQGLTFDATAGVASMSFFSGEVNRYVKNPASRSLVEGPILGRPAYLTPLQPAKYIYSPIQKGHSFRLLKVWPSTEPEAECVRCALVSANIEEMAGTYDTLSYTWGAQPQDFPVLITDHEDEKMPSAAVCVTPHLYAALLQLRGTREPIYLWIDQLCINQGSNEEKGSQVARMADIYRHSRRTVVWLGLCSDGDHALLQDLFTDKKFNSVSDLDGLLPATSAGRSSSPQAEQRHAAFTRMLNRTWFTRAWIFQEVVLSKTVEIRLGKLSAPLSTLIGLADAVCDEEVKTGGYARSLIMSTVGYDALFLIKHKRGCGTAGCERDRLLSDSFLALLMQALHQFCATDPRDYLYAYLVFQNQRAAITIQPNYTVAPAVAWTEAAMTLIRQSRSLDIFAAARGNRTFEGDGGKGFGGGLPSSADLPSWVPYWSDAFPHARPIYAPDFRTSFDASGGMTHAWVGNAGEGELIAQGAEVSTVEWLSPHNFAMSYHRNSGDGTKAVLSLETQKESLERHLSLCSDRLGNLFRERNPDVKVALMRTMLADGAFGHQRHMSDDKIRELTSVAESEAMTQEREDLVQQKQAQRTEIHNKEYRQLVKLRELALIVQLKRVFMTANGHLALASRAVEIGDRVWILRGSRTPCLLRQYGESGRFQVIGQCYVEGIMYGGAAQEGLSTRVVIV